MGSMRERAPGQWQLRVYAGDHRYVSRTIAGTERQARTALARLEVDVAERQATAPGAGSFGDLAELWWSTKDWRSAQSRVRARDHLNGYLIPLLGSVPLVRLDHDAIDRLYQDLLAGRRTLRGRPLAPGTVARIHSTLHACLEWGVKKGKLGRNPAARASAPSDPPTSVVPPEREDVAALIKAAVPPFDFFLALAAGTGRRRGDLLALRVRDLDLDAPSMSVARDKNGLSVKLAISKGLAVAAGDHLDTLAIQAGYLGTAYGPRSFVFSDDGGRSAWRPDSTSRKFRILAGRLGLEEANLHGLRHFHITELLSVGVDVETVATRVGDDPRTIYKTYSHFRPARDAAVAELWDRLMSS